MSENFSNQFLIAMPGLAESFFAQTLTFICEHNEFGALGLIVNQPLEMTFDELFAHLGIVDTPDNHSEAVLGGGPVQTDRGFVLHSGAFDDDWSSSLQINDYLRLTTSRDIIEAIACDDGPSQALIALGYAGWAPGQLDSEMAENAWLTVPADRDILFEIPYQERSAAAAAKLGIDLNLLSADFGNA